MSPSKKDDIKEIKRIIEIATVAIPKERDARNFYLAAAEHSPGEMSRQIFQSLADQEEEHEARLKALIAMFEERLDSLK